MANSLFAQREKPHQDKNLNDFFNKISGIYGTDPILVNGTVYLENLSEIKGNPYFLSEDWLLGDIFIRNQIYSYQKLKYNIETDELILNTGLNDSIFTTIRLNRVLIDSFSIYGHQFAHSRKFFPKDSLDVYFEIIGGRGFTFLQMHRKELNRKYSDNAPGGTYAEMVTQNFIFRDQKLFKIRNQKEFYHFFEENKHDIRKFMRGNHIKYRKATTRELKLLINYCSELTQPDERN